MTIRRIIIAFSAVITAVTSTAQARIEWVETTHDFGVFREEAGNVTCQMKGVNTGNEPLTILNVRANCGCTVARYSRDAVMPGDTAVVNVVYNADGRPGRFSKKVYIDTNTDPKRSTLTIKGVVIGTEATLRSRYPERAGELMLRNTVVPFGEILKGKSRIEFFEVYNHSGDTVTPQWHNVPEHITVNANPKSVPPGESLSYTLYFNTINTDRWGSVCDTLYLAPSETSDQRIAIATTATVAEDFSKLTPGERAKAPRMAVSHDAIDLDRIDRNTLCSASFKIDNRGDSPLLIRRAYTDDPGVTIKVDKNKIKKGKSSEIKVTIDPSRCRGDILNHRITIITNDPERPTATVRLVGQFKQ